MSDLNFDATPNTKPVTISGKPYILKEATGEVTAKYRNVRIRSMKVSNNQFVGCDGFEENRIILVTGCLFELYEDGGVQKERKVTELQVKNWPDRIVNALFEEARNLSPNILKDDEDLNKKGEDAAKNLQPSTQDGSQ